MPASTYHHKERCILFVAFVKAPADDCTIAEHMSDFHYSFAKLLRLWLILPQVKVTPNLKKYIIFAATSYAYKNSTVCL